MAPENGREEGTYPVEGGAGGVAQHVLVSADCACAAPLGEGDAVQSGVDLAVASVEWKMGVVCAPDRDERAAIPPGQGSPTTQSCSVPTTSTGWSPRQMLTREIETEGDGRAGAF